ncbi:hypothetical protein NIB75_14845 [Bacteroides uniformis]|nr:hypothetical protein [Bacteroides uniformis]
MQNPTPTIDLKDRKERVYSIVGWGQSHGEIIDNNDIVTTGNFNDGTLKQLQHTLWKGYDSKPSNLDNRALVSDTKHVNTTIAQAYINNQGQHVTITDAELYLTFPDRTCRLPRLPSAIITTRPMTFPTARQGRQIHYHP